MVRGGADLRRMEADKRGRGPLLASKATECDERVGDLPLLMNASCDDRKHMHLYPRIYHRDGGGWFFGQLGKGRNGSLHELRCPEVCFIT